MEEIKKYPAPIDNKHILTDFTEVFHNGDCVYRTIGKHHYEYFVINDCLCEVYYCYGLNVFQLSVVKGENLNSLKCQCFFDSIISELHHDNVYHEVVVEKKDNGSYAFYIVDK